MQLESVMGVIKQTHQPVHSICKHKGNVVVEGYENTGMAGFEGMSQPVEVGGANLVVGNSEVDSQSARCMVPQLCQYLTNRPVA
jgi:hypothetical protein